MKRLILLTCIAISMVSVNNCGTVQSIVQNAVPYTTQILVSSGSEGDQEFTITSSATSFAQYVGAGTDMVKDIRVTSAKVTASGQTVNDNLGIFKSIKIYLSGNNTEEVLVAERTDIGSNLGKTINLDPDISQDLDQVVKTGSVKARIVYVLKETAKNDTNLTLTMRFTSNPMKK